MQRALIAVIVVIALITACGSEAERSDAGLTTTTDSAAFDTTAERVDFLSTYAAVPSPVLDTNFHVFYRDNSTGFVPGPSDWTISYAVRVDPDDLEKWTEGFAVIDPVDEWDESKIEGWTITDEDPTFYHFSGMTRAVYEADSVVVGHSTTLG